MPVRTGRRVRWRRRLRIAHAARRRHIPGGDRPPRLAVPLAAGPAARGGDERRALLIGAQAVHPHRPGRLARYRDGGTREHSPMDIRRSALPRLWVGLGARVGRGLVLPLEAGIRRGQADRGDARRPSPVSVPGVARVAGDAVDRRRMDRPHTSPGGIRGARIPARVGPHSRGAGEQRDEGGPGHCHRRWTGVVEPLDLLRAKRRRIGTSPALHAYVRHAGRHDHRHRRRWRVRLHSAGVADRALPIRSRRRPISGSFRPSSRPSPRGLASGATT